MTEGMIFTHQSEPLINFIDAAITGDDRRLFMNLFAPVGFGKTQLLRDVWELYEARLPACYLDCESYRKKDAFALEEFLAQIIKDLSYRLPPRLVSLPAAYESIPSIKQAEVIISLVQCAAAYEKITVLLIDNFDALPEMERHFFEKRILGPMAQLRKGVVIFATETEQRFTEFELRRKLITQELSGVSQDTISQTYPKYSSIASDIYRVTGGLPLLTTEYVSELDKYQISGPDMYHALADELIHKHYQSHVNQTIFADVSKDTRETILVLALLRYFDVIILGKVLSTLMPGVYQSYDTTDYVDLIERLSKWIEWRLQGGYSLHASLQIVLQGYLFFEEPSFHEKINRIALKAYRDLLFDGYRQQYLIESLYHLGVLLKIENRDAAYIQNEIGKELLTYLKRETDRALEEVDIDALRRSLAKDKDLGEFVSEDVQVEMRRILESTGFANGVIKRIEEEAISDPQAIDPEKPK